MNFTSTGIRPVQILLPKAGTDLQKWACVACDQFTSQADYWQQVAELVGTAPSTLNLMLPEVYLSSGKERIPVIHASMKEYQDSGILQSTVDNGFVLVERTTASGCRTGLICGVDLEEYDYRKGTAPLIRPTEETIAARLPARQEIRRNAPLELTHIMVLVDDPLDLLLGGLKKKKDQLKQLYDFPLMMGGGQLAGWAVEAEEDLQAVLNAVNALMEQAGNEDPLVYAVGDGNHSLATAKACWEEIRAELSEEERKTHPARYALCELVNIHDAALLFEPIHRILKGVSADQLLTEWRKWCDGEGQTLTIDAAGVSDTAAQRLTLISGDREQQLTLSGQVGAICCETVQRFLDAFLKDHPQVSIDYIHGDDDLRTLCREPACTGILLPAIDKFGFFDSVKKLGTLPRKTFSMGEAREKRYYMEARKIRY